MKKTFILVLISIFGTYVSAQTFTSNTSLLNNEYHSGGVVGVTDMNNDGFDDIIIMDNSNTLYLEYQNSDGTFTSSYIGQMSGNSQWGMAIGDFDNDGHNDVVSGGNFDGFHLAMIESPTESTISTDNNNQIFMQGMSIADINTDGWLDVFGCNDVGLSNIWGNDGVGNLDQVSGWINTVTTPASDNSGNYGSVFSDIDDDGDIDMYIAKCRQGVTNPNDPRRINALFINDGNNNFTEEAAVRGLAPLKQSWTSDFMDIDNDGDFDCFLTNHDYSLMILENDGTGYFTDITQSSGMQNTTGFFLQGKFEDFDNDGFVDLLYAGGLAGLFHNNGDNTFTQISIPFNNEDVLHSFGIGDLNHDGFSDFYASYGDGYVSADNNNDDRIWFNDGNDNNWLTVQLDPQESNQSAIGAKVKIYGDWGVQVREVRSGESYGIINSFDCHFGLGESTSITYMTVEWPTGDMTFVENPGINQFLEVTENNDCPELTISIDGGDGTLLCPDETAELTATSSTTNTLWSNGSTTSMITVAEPGNYSAIAYDENGCAATSETIVVEFNETIEPLISASGQLIFCSGESIDLMVDNIQETNSYVWSNDDEGTVSEITSSGTYLVTTTDVCDNEISSSSLDVEVLTAPEVEVEDQQLVIGETVTFSSNTEYTYWYETESSETPLYEGTEFTTPVLNENTSYWVQTSTENTAVEYSGGKLNNADGQYHGNSDYWLYFDAYTDVTIQSFKVYSGSDGTRTIYIENDQGEEVFTIDIFIPEGISYIDINAFVPEGNDYAIRTVGDPDLWRDSSDDNLPYPYEFDDALAITGTNINSNNWDNYYYFFYDWTILVGDEVCYSDLMEIHASTDVSISSMDEINDEYLVYPNPFSESITISKKENGISKTEVRIFNAIGELVFQENINLLNNQEITLDLSKLNQGVYTINVLSDNKISTYKLLKQ